MALASQAACPLFQQLPPEVRNQIYEYAFTTYKSRHKALVTAAIKRPDNNFLITCQRGFAEANGIYQVARTTYWEKSTFYLDRLSKDMYTWPSDPEIIDNLHERELNLIREIIITYGCEDAPVKWHLTTRRNDMKGWIATTPLADQMKKVSVSGKRKGLYQILDFLS